MSPEYRYYLTAVNGGGRTDDALHTDVTSPRTDEIFTLVRAD